MGSQQMVKYIGKKLISVVLMLLIVSAFTFMIIHLTPGDPARVMLGVDAPEEQVEQLREQMGLNRPLPVQYVDWLNDVLHGDLGESIFIDQPLTEIIAERMRPTIELTIFALIIAVVIAIPTGIASARGRGRGIDQGMMVLSMLGVSVPNFLLGLLLVLVFAVGLKWFPASGYKTIAEAGFKGYISRMILPAVSLGMMHAAEPHDALRRSGGARQGLYQNGKGKGRQITRADAEARAQKRADPDHHRHCAELCVSDRGRAGNGNGV